MDEWLTPFFIYNIVLQKKRSRRRSKTVHSTSTVASRDAVVESTTNELVYSRPTSDIVETSEVLKQIKKRSISIESIHSAGLVVAAAAPEVIPAASSDVASDATAVATSDATPSANGTYMNHVIVEKMIDIDNNNEKVIDHGDQAG